MVTSRRKYFVRFLLEVFDGERLVFSHASMRAKERSFAWSPLRSAIRLRGCRSSMHFASSTDANYMLLGRHCSRFFARVIRVCISGRTKNWTQAEMFYATYYIGFLALLRARSSADRPTRQQHAGHDRVPARRAVRGAPAEWWWPTRRADHRALCLHRDAIHRAMQVLEQPARLADADRVSENTRLPRAVHRPRIAIRQRRAYEHDARRPEDFTGNRPLQERASLLITRIFLSDWEAGCRGSRGPRARPS